MEAIIFLAPISAFDQVLSEDPQVNRLVRHLYLADSLDLIFLRPRRRTRYYYGKVFAKTSYWPKSISCSSSTNATSSNANSILVFGLHDM